MKNCNFAGTYIGIGFDELRPGGRRLDFPVRIVVTQAGDRVSFAVTLTGDRPIDAVHGFGPFGFSAPLDFTHQDETPPVVFATALPSQGFFTLRNGKAVVVNLTFLAFEAAPGVGDFIICAGKKE